MIIGLDGNEANVKKRVGSGVYALQLLKQFASDKNHKFIVFLKENPLSDLPKETSNFKYLFFGPKKLWTQFALPIKLFFGSNLDIFFSLGHYGPRFSKIKYAITIFDLSYMHFPDLFKKDDLYKLNKWSEYSIKKASHVLTISSSTKNDIVKYYGINPAKISVNYLGYDRKIFKPQAKRKIAKIREKYKINGDYIIFVGTLQPRKNIERLIEAFHRVLTSSGSHLIRTKKNPDVPIARQPDNLQLVIVGKKGWLYDSIFAKVKELNLEDKVIFTGYAPDPDLSALISGARVYVLPSLWEGFGIPVIEAQACGVPVVVSNMSSLPEIVGDSAVLIDPLSVSSITSGIKKVLNNKKLSQKLTEKGFENIRRFSWQNCATETLKVLKQLASN